MTGRQSWSPCAQTEVLLTSVCTGIVPKLRQLAAVGDSLVHVPANMPPLARCGLTVGSAGLGKSTQPTQALSWLANSGLTSLLPPWAFCWQPTKILHICDVF